MQAKLDQRNAQVCVIIRCDPLPYFSGLCKPFTQACVNPLPYFSLFLRLVACVNPLPYFSGLCQPFTLFFYIA